MLVTSLVVWGAGILANNSVLAATGLPPRLDMAARMLVAGYLVGLAPAPPARLGVFEAGIAIVLTPMGIPLPETILTLPPVKRAGRHQRDLVACVPALAFGRASVQGFGVVAGLTMLLGRRLRS